MTPRRPQRPASLLVGPVAFADGRCAVIGDLAGADVDGDVIVPRFGREGNADELWLWVATRPSAGPVSVRADWPADGVRGATASFAGGLLHAPYRPSSSTGARGGDTRGPVGRARRPSSPAIRSRVRGSGPLVGVTRDPSTWSSPQRERPAVLHEHPGRASKGQQRRRPVPPPRAVTAEERRRRCATSRRSVPIGSLGTTGWRSWP